MENIRFTLFRFDFSSMLSRFDLLGFFFFTSFTSIFDGCFCLDCCLLLNSFGSLQERIFLIWLDLISYIG